MVANRTTTPAPIAIFFQAFMASVTVQAAVPIGPASARSQAVTPEIHLQIPTPAGVTGTHSGIRSCWQESSNLEFSAETLGIRRAGAARYKVIATQNYSLIRPGLKIFEASGGQLGRSIAASNRAVGSERQSILLMRLSLAFAQMRA
jgi:hypothetical protein